MAAVDGPGDLLDPSSTSAVPPTAVLDAVSCLVVVAELATGNVLHVNSAVQALCGYSQQDLLGRSWEKLLEQDDQRTMRAAIAGPDGSALGFETTVICRSGDRRRVLWSIAFTGDDAAGHVVLSGIDVTPTLRTAGLFSQIMRTAAAPALVGTDLHGRVTLYNAAAEALLGHPAASVLGRVLPLDLFDPTELEERAVRLGVPANLRLLTGDLSKLDRRRRDVDLGPLDRRRRDTDGSRIAERRSERRADDGPRTGPRGDEDRRGQRASQARDWTLVRHNGERFTASLTVVAVADAEGGVVGYLGVAEDVSEQRRSRSLLVAGLEKEVESVRRLRELDRAKDDFVATVSHELRTPITSIMGYVELLLDTFGDMDTTQVEMLEAVQRNGDRLRTLADNLLTLSSFESGEFVLHATTVNLCDVVVRAEEALRPLIDDRRLHTSFDVPPEPVWISGDAAHLERALFNLLGNALKFTEDGGSLCCQLGREGDVAVLQVTDTGIGIPAAEQDQLFTSFFRSSTAQQRAIPGTGMGLAIVSALVRQHGGEVQIESDERVGTTASIRLPCLPADVGGPGQE